MEHLFDPNHLAHSHGLISDIHVDFPGNDLHTIDGTIDSTSTIDSTHHAMLASNTTLASNASGILDYHNHSNVNISNDTNVDIGDGTDVIVIQNPFHQHTDANDGHLDILVLPIGDPTDTTDLSNMGSGDVFGSEIPENYDETLTEIAEHLHDNM